MIEVNGKVYRNLQEQVYENTIDIDELKRMYGYRGPYESTADIENPVDLGLYLIGTEAPYAIYQYHELTQNYTDLGLFNQRGPQGTPGEQGPVGPQGPEGEKGDPVTISVNGTTYESYMGNITLPDYPDTMAWANITGKPTKLSDFTNDQGYITNDVDNLTNYYDKTTIGDLAEDYTKTADLATVALTGSYDDLINIPTNLVTTDTVQTITADKIFNNPNKAYQITTSDSGLQVEQKEIGYGSVTQLNYYGLTLLEPNVSSSYGSGYYINYIDFRPVSASNAYKIRVRDSQNYSTSYDYSFVQGKSGEVAVTSEIPNTSNMVTTDTNQTITGSKTFDNNTYFTHHIHVSDISGITDISPSDIRLQYGNTINNTMLSPISIIYSHGVDDPEIIKKFKIGIKDYNADTFESEYFFVPGKSGEVAITSEIPDVSDFVTDTELTTTLADYELKSEAFSGDYTDLTNKPDLSVYAETADLGDCAYLDENELSIAYSQITGTPTIPTKTSDLTNDSGFITGVTWNDVTNKPTFATVATTGDYDDLTNKPTIPTNTSDLTNDSGFITSSALSGYATETWVGNQGYITGITSSDVTTALGYTPGTSNFSGDYNDLTNKPTIPDAVSGTNDGTNWTSLTIGSDTYGLASGGSTYTAGTGIDITNDVISIDNTVALKTDIPTIPTNVSAFTNDAGYITSSDLPTNYVTTDTAQNITAAKTFVGDKLIKFKMASSSQKLGFTCYDNNNKEVGYLEARIKSNVPQISLGMYNTQSSSYDRKLQLSYQSNNGGTTYNYNLVCPTRLQKNGNDVYMPVSFTATSATAVEATNTGSVDLTNVIEQVLRNHGLIS